MFLSFVYLHINNASRYLQYHLGQKMPSQFIKKVYQKEKYIQHKTGQDYFK